MNRAIATDGVAWSVGLFVGLLVTLVSPDKMAKAIEMPFVVTNSRGSKEPRIVRRVKVERIHSTQQSRDDKAAMRPFVKVF